MELGFTGSTSWFDESDFSEKPRLKAWMLLPRDDPSSGKRLAPKISSNTSNIIAISCMPNGPIRKAYHLK
ncbi:uncharacterized protein METZ01_LOCUS71023 [marine metagenome]|uniref:Uncharacterized protein n=1 Tax=marine metagenome TaxID=408172 RepID=A0A381TQS1_9ZZZZ